MAQINRSSFLVFFDSGGEEKLPMPYVQNKTFRNPEVILVPGESYSIYVRADVGSITAISDGVTDYPVTSSIESVVALAETHTIVNFSIGSVPEGTYYFKSGGLRSQIVGVIPAPDANNHSAIVEFWHFREFGNFYYPYVPDFKNRIRIRLNTLNSEPFIDKKIYNRSSDWKQGSLDGSRIRFTNFETKWYSDIMHDACELMTMHSNVEINGIKYTYRPENSYAVQGEPGSMLSNGVFAMVRNDSTILLEA